jgi:hypothetical protein
VTSTEDKESESESESEGDKLKHKASKITKKNTRSIYSDFMDITHNGIGMNEELDDSLIFVHQNIRGLSSKISEFTSLLTLDYTNSQFLCFSEHHISEANLCVINIENYNLSTSFRRQIYQKMRCLYIC